MTEKPETRSNKPRRNMRGWAQLWAACGLIAVVWIGVLPRLAESPRVQARLEYLEARRIDPSAMFYTELEGLDRVLGRLERFHQRQPRALWLPE